MTNFKKSTAVIVFALSQEEEIKRKPFLKNNLFQQKFTSRICNILDKTGLEYFLFDEKKQEGSSFGERFCNAITKIYDKGYDAVITIGNDTPNLHKNHITKTIQALQQGKSVIGPSFDGGFYIMGLHKEAFCYQQFLEFSWNSSHVRKELCAYLESYPSTYVQLDFLYDLDQICDIKKVYSSLYFELKQTYLILQKLLQKRRIIDSFVIEILIIVTLKSYYNKGSPSSTS
ncbi:DUF2064 domain-containing protein [Aquimarina sp. RZ0]|uniref:DUF2064 domain-containing protein n=1 Tax=Aquimarina sp. RZ0 TaxID=2607730 RepID=UPI0011F10BA4|nr:DUF2064 domain-containing protein [Aquimarina sp. RZ0]KAA1246825.1 DUF2064 domain-containing protein [Aquimarina sp. RZ0]